MKKISQKTQKIPKTHTSRQDYPHFIAMKDMAQDAKAILCKSDVWDIAAPIKNSYLYTDTAEPLIRSAKQLNKIVEDAHKVHYACGVFKDDTLAKTAEHIKEGRFEFLDISSNFARNYFDTLFILKTEKEKRVSWKNFYAFSKDLQNLFIETFLEKENFAEKYFEKYFPQVFAISKTIFRKNGFEKMFCENFENNKRAHFSAKKENLYFSIKDEFVFDPCNKSSEKKLVEQIEKNKGSLCDKPSVSFIGSGKGRARFDADEFPVDDNRLQNISYFLCHYRVPNRG